MTLRKLDSTENWERKHALSEKLAFVEAMDML
jgi:hypothetical protein